MLILITLAAMIGGFATVFALSGYGLLTAVLLSPFGGSMAALTATALVLLFDMTRSARQYQGSESSPSSAPRQG